MGNGGIYFGTGREGRGVVLGAGRQDVYKRQVRNLKEIFGQYAMENPKLGKELIKQLLEIADLKRLVDQISINIPLYYEEKQKILEAEMCIRDRDTGDSEPGESSWAG